MPLLDSVHEQATQTLLNSHDHVQHLQLNTCLPLRFFNNQFRICVYENESRTLMHFQTEPHIRILAG